ncbi:hypothetical protein AWC38_SpisGene12315 [Stylophora pistillata]|uniref:Uncharacterized protein n=1 Tax=Stylophora pistillata TaxID=50429 RepID=A0A2B4S3I1_STYPI|nr:hypothetical protein AWC38_SpisGene12315 [Stylophora pistillata]
MPCNVHVVHNSFRRALSEYGQHTEQLALDLFYWFKAHPARKEDYFKAQTNLGFDEQLFTRHVQSRWLTLIPALTRIVDNWESICSYFLKELPKELLIHILHNECLQLVKRLMLRFLKPEIADNNSKKLLQLDVQKSDHQLPDSRMEIGKPTRKIPCTLPPSYHKISLKGMRTFLQTSAIYLLKHFPIGDTIVRDLTVLHPEMREIEAGDHCLRRIAQSLPQVFKGNQVPIVVDEWKLYRHQEIPEDWYKTHDSETVLTLSHGDADIERSLSINKQAIGANRTLLTHESLNGIKQVKDAVTGTDGKIHVVDFSKELISCTRNANDRDRQRLEEQKKQEEAQKNERVRRKEAEKHKKIAEEKAFEERKRKLKETEKGPAEAARGKPIEAEGSRGIV